jgi:SulP family sulfate permease
MAFAMPGLSPSRHHCAVVSASSCPRWAVAVPDREPSGAFVVVVAGIVSKYGVDGLFMCTVAAGVMLVIMGFTGGVGRFIPRPVVVGFTNGLPSSSPAPSCAISSASI